METFNDLMDYGDKGIIIPPKLPGKDGVKAQLTALTFKSTFVPDLDLLTTVPYIRDCINTIFQNAKNTLLTSTAPSATTVASAVSAYETLVIATGNQQFPYNLTDFNQLLFLGTFVEYLKFNPNDTAMKQRAMKVIEIAYYYYGNNMLQDNNFAAKFLVFANKATFMAEYGDYTINQKLLYMIQKAFNNPNQENQKFNNSWNIFWQSTYNQTSQQTSYSIVTDFVYYFLPTLVLMVKCFNTIDEQFRYMRTLKRFIQRFISSFTNGTLDGLKVDGSFYHHLNNYEAYAYCLQTVATVLNMFDKTCFQISAETYIIFREAIMHKMLVTNDLDLVPLIMTGRTGNWDMTTFKRDYLKIMTILGGQILGIPTADPVLASVYIRKYGVDKTIKYGLPADFQNGFYQNNHACAGHFRTRRCLITCKGFTNILWGAEIYLKENRYGKYQSYGSLSIVYKGSADLNGFNNTKWDWNYNPGATTKVLPFAKLQASVDYFSERQANNFVGGLQFLQLNQGYLNKHRGRYGMFAMDFQQVKQIKSTTLEDSHDQTFAFKKTYFFFQDIIICLGSNISNADTINPTITTLYQNCTNPNYVVVNDKVYSTLGTNNFTSSQDNWVFDSLNNGYYIVKGSGTVTAQRRMQQTPSPNQPNPTILNVAAEAELGYINHGKAPKNLGYEYAILPNTNKFQMLTLVSLFANTTTRPYTVVSKTAKQHIIWHRATGILGLALFQASTNIPGNTNIISTDTPCLIMYQTTNSNTKMKLNIVNPDLNIQGVQSTLPFPTVLVTVVLRGKWELANSHVSIKMLSLGATTATYQFSTSQGVAIEANLVINGPAMQGVGLGQLQYEQGKQVQPFNFDQVVQQQEPKVTTENTTNNQMP